MQSIVNDIFNSIYQYLGFGIVFAVITMIALPEIKKNGIKIVIRNLWNALRRDVNYRNSFFFFLYLFMVLSRTLICRNIWQCPWQNIIGEWGIITSEGKFNTEGILNIILFLPLTYFGLQSFGPNLTTTKKILNITIKISFLFSCGIEICQLFFRLGTFQLSDIFQNTLGGLIGAIVYVAAKRKKKK